MAEFFIRRKNRVAGPFSADQLQQRLKRKDANRLRDGDMIRVGRDGNWMPFQTVLKRLVATSSRDSETATAAPSSSSTTPRHRGTERQDSDGHTESTDEARRAPKPGFRLIVGAAALIAVATTGFLLWPPDDSADNQTGADESVANQTAEIADSTENNKPSTQPSQVAADTAGETEARTDDLAAATEATVGTADDSIGVNDDVPQTTQQNTAKRPDELITNAQAVAKWTPQFGDAMSEVFRIVSRIDGSLCVETSESGQPRLRIKAQAGTVAYRQITDADLAVFARIDGAVHLSLDYCRGFTMAGFRSLSQMKQLEIAGFNGCRTLTDEMVLELPADNLTYFGVKDSKVTDAIAHHVSRMRLLQQINVSNTAAGDKVLEACAELPQLKQVLAVQTAFSKATVERLRTRRGTLRIDYTPRAVPSQVASSSPQSGQSNSANSTSTAAGPAEATVPEPTGERPESSVALIAANPKLQAWMRTIPSPKTRENIIASIDSLLQNEKKAEEVIAVGKVEMPVGAVPLPDGVPAGGILFHQDERLDVRFGRPTFTLNGSIYSTSFNSNRAIQSSHWPWFVTSLDPGRTTRIQALTLQHAPATIIVPDTGDRHSVVLPTVNLQPAGANDVLTLKANVSDGSQPLPASARMGLPGFTQEATMLNHSFVTGEVELSIPQGVFDLQDKLTIHFSNAFHSDSSRAIKIDDFGDGQADLGDLVLSPRQSHMASTLFTTTGSLRNGTGGRLHCDTTSSGSTGMARSYVTVAPNHQLTITRSGDSLTVGFGPMTHFADLGTDFPDESRQRPVDTWLDVNDLRPGSRFTATAGHTYLLKCREPQNADDPRWGLVHIEPANNAFDNFVSTGQSFGQGFAKLAHRLARYRNPGFSIVDSSTGPSLRIQSGLDDDDAKLLTSFTGEVNVSLSRDSRLSPRGLKQIARSRSVSRLEFIGWNIGANHVKALEQSQLASLRFEDCQLLSAFPALRLPMLNLLDVKGCSTDGRFVAALAGCTALTTLRFEDCSGLQGQEAAFAYLPGNLRSLTLRNCMVDPQLTTVLRQQRGTSLYVSIQER